MTARRALIAIALLLVVIAIAFLSLPWLLISKADSGTADAILYLSVDPYSKSDDFVYDLYRRKAAPRIMVASSQISYELYQADFTGQHLIKLGVPQSDVSSYHLPITDCLAEIVRIMQAESSRRGWKRVLIVVNPAESRYARMLFQRYFEPAGIDVLVTYSPQTYKELTDDWWRTHWKAQVMVETTIGPMLDVWYQKCR